MVRGTRVDVLKALVQGQEEVLTKAVDTQKGGVWLLEAVDVEVEDMARLFQRAFAPPWWGLFMMNDAQEEVRLVPKLPLPFKDASVATSKMHLPTKVQFNQADHPPKKVDRWSVTQVAHSSGQPQHLVVQALTEVALKRQVALTEAALKLQAALTLTTRMEVRRHPAAMTQESWQGPI